MSADETRANVRPAIEAANRQFMHAFNQGDADSIAALYTEDGQILPPNADTSSGRPAIQIAWQVVMDTGIREVALETVEVEEQGDTAYEVGRYTFLIAGDQMIDTGKYLIIWKAGEGQWQRHRDIWNSGLPAPGQSRA